MIMFNGINDKSTEEPKKVNPEDLIERNQLTDQDLIRLRKVCAKQNKK